MVVCTKSWAWTAPVNQLEDVLEEANESYHNGTTVLLSDEHFDAFIEILKARNPNSVLLAKIGAEVRGNRHRLPYHLGSQNKLTTDEAVGRWCSKIGVCSGFVVSHKVDGISALLTAGGTMFTRGDGDFGKKITSTSSLTLPPGVSAIRGELYIPGGTRQDTAGLVNGNSGDKSRLVFVGYEVFGTGRRIFDQFKLLQESGYSTPFVCVTDDISVHNLRAILHQERARDDIHYPMDGLVVTADVPYAPVTSGNPLHSFAFKVPSAPCTDTTVTCVEWRVSRGGRLIPRVHFTPVHLNGECVQRTSGFNARYIRDHGIGPGAGVTISLQGDVIPVIVGVKEPSPSGAQLPAATTSWAWDTNGVHICTEGCSENPGISVKHITFFLRTLGVLGIDERRIARIVDDLGVGSVADFLGLGPEEIATVHGFSVEGAGRLVGEVHSRLYGGQLDAKTLLVASGVMGPGAGAVRAQKVADAFPDIWGAGTPSVVEVVQRVPAFNEGAASLFIERLQEFKQVVRPVIQTVGASTDTTLANTKEVVFTGFRDKILESTLAEFGYRVGPSVSKSTWALVAQDLSKRSGKVTKAEKMGVRVLTVEQLKSELQGYALQDSAGV